MFKQTKIRRKIWASRVPNAISGEGRFTTLIPQHRRRRAPTSRRHASILVMIAATGELLNINRIHNISGVRTRIVCAQDRLRRSLLLLSSNWQDFMRKLASISFRALKRIPELKLFVDGRNWLLSRTNWNNCSSSWGERVESEGGQERLEQLWPIYQFTWCRASSPTHTHDKSMTSSASGSHIDDDESESSFRVDDMADLAPLDRISRALHPEESSRSLCKQLGERTLLVFHHKRLIVLSNSAMSFNWFIVLRSLPKCSKSRGQLKCW